MPVKATTTLTTRGILALKTKDVQYQVADAELANFGVYVTPTGTKTFYVRYRNGDGAAKRYRIGDFPVMALTDARLRAKAVLGRVAEDLDPQFVKQDARTGHTFAEVLAAYVEYISAPVGGNPTKPPVMASWQARQSELERLALPEWRNRPFKTITRDDAIALYAKVRKQHGSGARNRTHRSLSAMFSWALSEPWGKGMPAHPLLRIKRDPSIARERVMSVEELVAVWWAPTHSSRALDVVRLQMLTMQRGKEVKMMLQEHVVGGVWAKTKLVFNETTKMWEWAVKNKTDHQVWLSEMAREIVERNRRAHPGHQRIFPSKSKQGYVKSINFLLIKARSVTNRKDFTLHDLRRTAATMVGEELGIDDAMIAKILNHTDRVGVTGVYNKAKYMNLKQEIMDSWAEIVQRLVGHKRPAAIPLPKWPHRKSPTPEALAASAARVTELRKRLGLNKSQFSRLVRTADTSTVRYWERGKTIPAQRYLARFTQLEKDPTATFGDRA